MCDGIVKYKGQYYILEIKTESSYKNTCRKEIAKEHYNQAITYSICLGINKVLFLYENRDNCDKKAFILEVTEEMKNSVFLKIKECNEYVEKLITPPKPKEVSKYACTYCSYISLCRKLG